MSTRNKIIQVPIDEPLLDSLDEASRERGQSRAALIREACEQFLKRLEEDRLDRIYEEGYRRLPEGEEEEAWAKIGEERLAELLAEDSW